MAITETVTCDVCGKQKGQVNHWWMYAFGGYQRMEIKPWNDSSADAWKHACGQGCVMKAVNEFMQGQGSLSALPVGQK